MTYITIHCTRLKNQRHYVHFMHPNLLGEREAEREILIVETPLH